MCFCVHMLQSGRSGLREQREGKHRTTDLNTEGVKDCRETVPIHEHVRGC